MFSNALQRLPRQLEHTRNFFRTPLCVLRTRRPSHVQQNGGSSLRLVGASTGEASTTSRVQTYEASSQVEASSSQEYQGTAMSLTDAQRLERRKQSGFRRADDGRVALQRQSDKCWFDVKLDLRAPGTLLLRDAEGGQMYFLQYSDIAQLDLSDDVVVANIAQNLWEETMTAYTTDTGSAAPAGEPLPVKLTRDEFYAIVSIFSLWDEQLPAKRGGFRRSSEGRVALQRRSDQRWFDVKCDLATAGFLLLRGDDGQVYFLVCNDLAQVDLTDDELVARLAQNNWDKVMRPFEVDGEVVQLQLSREQFYEVITAAYPVDEYAEPQKTDGRGQH